MLRFRTPLVLAVTAALVACKPQTTAVPDSSQTVTENSVPVGPKVDADRMVATIAHLADDGLLGRYTLAPEIHEAAGFLAKRYAEYGLRPVAEEMVVPYRLHVGAKLDGTPELVARTARNKELRFAPEAFRPLATSGSGRVEAEAIFVGYGASSDPAEDGTVAYDDLASIDLEGKIAVVFADAPGTPDFRALFQVFEEIGKDYAKAAAPLLEVEDEASVEKELRALHQQARKAMAEALAPFMRGAEMPEEFWKVSNLRVPELDLFGMLGPVMRMASELPGPRFTRSGRLSTKLGRLAAAKAAGVVIVRGPRSFLRAKDREEDALPELAPDPPRVLGDALDIPVVQLRWKEARKLFKAARMPLEKTQAKIDAELQPRSASMGLTLSLAAQLEPIEVEVPNVLAQIPGSDRADEVVLFGAHFDHIGSVGKGDCVRIDRTNDEICNGADDNASGTAMILELARAIQASGIQPSRTLMFASFSGEEMGLLGSEAMAEAPPFARDQVVAMVNLDMVGRLGTKGLAIGGVSTSEDWMPLLDEIGTKGMEVFYERSITSRSDHANWFAHQIPVLFFFTGLHSDYHRAGDHVDEINVDGMQTIGELALDLAMRLASGASIRYREPAEGEGLVGRLPGSDEATVEKRVEAD